jgi:hypothetical protein
MLQDVRDIDESSVSICDPAELYSNQRIVSVASVKFGQSATPDFSIFQYVAGWQVACNIRVCLPGGGPQKALKEEPMKSISELADIYETWATANEVRAEKILASLDSLLGDEEEQSWRASLLKADAAELKKRAKELRNLDRGMVEIVQDGYKVPQDRDRDCKRPQTIWRYNRFR